MNYNFEKTTGNMFFRTILNCLGIFIPLNAEEK
jgi:hypothetical protein